MLMIMFQGREYLFVGDDLDASGAIATVADFRAGRVSYAHYYPHDGGYVNRYGKRIGEKADIAVIGPADLEPQTREEMVDAIATMLTDPGWDGRPS